MTSNQELDVLRKIPITQILGIKNQGAKIIKIRCPIHNEKTPSMTLYQDGSWKCYGCNANGQNAIDFLMSLGASFSEAVDELKRY